LQLLSNRPDVQAAEMALAANYYNTNQARAAFYPQVTINGQAGWTNNLGVITNPAKFLTSIVGSITQPLFYRGRLVAALKAAKANEEKSKLQFQTALLNAGNEVSNALYEYEMCQEKAAAREVQVASAKNASEYTAANGGKPWKYALLAHDVVDRTSSFQYLMAFA
jgi:outer membrane protein TolC